MDGILMFRDTVFGMLNRTVQYERTFYNYDNVTRSLRCIIADLKPSKSQLHVKLKVSNSTIRHLRSRWNV
jgi:hypothetical protein